MAIQPAGNARRNGVLAALSSRDFAMLQPYLEPVRLTNVYFPEAGLASMVAIGRGGHRRAEVAIIGREGMTGLPVVHGTDQSPCDVFMQIEGYGQRISANQLGAAMDQSGTLLRSLFRFAHVSAVQSIYTAMANAQANIEERLARWLLMAHDRIDGDKLALTHDFLAVMLAVRRAGVTTALGHLERKGVVETARGAVIVKDRDGLEKCANGFYGVPEAEFERLFGGPTS
jgi:CRP-like cAMP-binding protein